LFYAGHKLGALQHNDMLAALLMTAGVMRVRARRGRDPRGAGRGGPGVAALAINVTLGLALLV